MGAAPFYLSYLIVPTVVVGQQLGGLWSFLPVAVILGLLPSLDWLLGRSKPAEPSSASAYTASLAYRLAPILWVPVQTGLVIWLFVVFATHPPPPLEFAGLVLSVGIVTGGIGITIAHELTHRPSWLERRLADVLMITVGYHHFCIEHVHGHHRRVATPDDPATARYGEGIYRFFLRTVIGQFFSAWALEAARLRRRGHGWFDVRNRVLVGIVVTFGYYVLVGVVAGWQAFVFASAFGIVAVFLLETINYTEHYGLMRRPIAAGRYEPVAPRHSWDASERLTSWLLVNLQRHADHHMRPGVAYPGLVARGDAPQLPAGYATMLIVATMPTLWFNLMNPRVEAWRAAQPPLEAAAE